MFGKAWKKFWGHFDNMMDELPNVIDEAKKSGASEVTISDGDIDIRGKFNSLKINGYTIRVPDKVMKGK